MKVLHVISVIAPRYGGPSAVIVPLCRALNALPGTDVELATTDADGAGRVMDRSQIPRDFPVHMFRRVLSERWQYSSELRAWLRDHVSDYDLVHIHALWNYAAGAAARAARKAGVPYIIRPAGMLSPYTFSRSAWKKRCYWLLRERGTIRHSAAFHATSSQEAEDIRRCRSDAQIMIVPNGVEDSASTEPTNRDALAEVCKSTSCHRPVVLFLSRLHPKKGITDVLLPAFACMKVNATLAIAGGEDDRAPGYEIEIRQTISRYRLHDRVVLLGPVNGNQRWALFDSADLFVLPSHSENFGVVVAEAMARGCPVVVADSVQSWMHVVAAGAGEVVPGDAANVATALDRVLSDTALRKRYGEAGLVYAERHFRWNQIAQQVQEMYWESLYVPRVSNQDKGKASKDVGPRMRAITKP